MKYFCVQNFDSYRDKILDACYELNIPYKTFGIIPFVNKIVFSDLDIPEDAILFPYGSTKLINILTKNSRNFELYYNDNFNFVNQVSHVRKYLLNGDARVFKLADIKNETFKKDMFVKPVNDLKMFNGTIIKSGNSLQDFFNTVNLDSEIYNEDSGVIINNVQEFHSETRCFIGLDKILSTQPYNNNQIVPSQEEVENIVFKFKPADFYVCDICCTKEGWKIVEYNCFHCSGVYKNKELELMRNFMQVYFK